jgi:hypothetical protein
VLTPKTIHFGFAGQGLMGLNPQQSVANAVVPVIGAAQKGSNAVEAGVRHEIIAI